MTPPTSQQLVSRDIEKMAEAFLSWPLPESVCADRCTTEKSKGRIGTNLLTYTEAEQMFQDIVGSRIKELTDQRENMCGLISRLCRQSYKLGLKNKLTDDAMNYINKTDAKNTPASKLLRKILSLPKTP
jgi:hypothetical protein